jgi:hypothetical protein
MFVIFCEDEVREIRQRSEEESKNLLFVNKKKQKNFILPRALALKVPSPARAKVFCFFFSKKKRLLALLARPARRGCRLSPA